MQHKNEENFKINFRKEKEKSNNTDTCSPRAVIRNWISQNPIFPELLFQCSSDSTTNFNRSTRVSIIQKLFLKHFNRTNASSFLALTDIVKTPHTVSSNPKIVNLPPRNVSQQSHYLMATLKSSRAACRQSWKVTGPFVIHGCGRARSRRRSCIPGFLSETAKLNLPILALDRYSN